jgi:hypothetical protein
MRPLGGSTRACVAIPIRSGVVRSGDRSYVRNVRPSVGRSARTEPDRGADCGSVAHGRTAAVGGVPARREGNVRLVGDPDGNGAFPRTTVPERVRETERYSTAARRFPRRIRPRGRGRRRRGWHPELPPLAVVPAPVARRRAVRAGAPKRHTLRGAGRHATRSNRPVSTRPSTPIGRFLSVAGIDVGASRSGAERRGSGRRSDRSHRGGVAPVSVPTPRRSGAIRRGVRTGATERRPVPDGEGIPAGPVVKATLTRLGAVLLKRPRRMVRTPPAGGVEFPPSRHGGTASVHGREPAPRFVRPAPNSPPTPPESGRPPEP